MAQRLTTFTSLWDLIEQRAADTPDARFVIDEDGRTLTFAEYRDASLRAAAAFHARGIGEGDVVSWQLPTWIEAMVLVGGLARLGAVQNPILPIYREREVGFVVRESEAKLLVVAGRVARLRLRRDGAWSRRRRRGHGGPPGRRRSTATSTRSPPVPAGGEPFEPGVRHDGPLRWLFYTSGTTADPKGARHTDNTVAAAAWAMVDAFDLTADDRNALVFPFTHIGGIGWLMAGLMAGCTQVIVEGFVPDDDDPGARARACDDRGRGHAVPHGVPRRAGARPTTRCSPRPGSSWAAARPSRRSSTTT